MFKNWEIFLDANQINFFPINLDKIIDQPGTVTRTTWILVTARINQC